MLALLLALFIAPQSDATVLHINGLKFVVVGTTVEDFDEFRVALKTGGNVIKLLDDGKISVARDCTEVTILEVVTFSDDVQGVKVRLPDGREGIVLPTHITTRNIIIERIRLKLLAKEIRIERG